MGKYLVLSWKTFRSRSSSPEASGYSFEGGIIGWSRETMEREISFCSGRCIFVSVDIPRLPFCKRLHTLGSGIAPGVCTWTIFCTNLIAHIRTPIGALSHLLSISDLIEAISFHTGTSCGFAILERTHVRQSSLRVYIVLFVYSRIVAMAVYDGRGRINVHVMKDQRVYTCGSLNDTFHHPSIFPRHLQ